MSSSLRQNFKRNWFAMEALPLYCIVGFVLSLGTFFLTHAATKPDVIWTRDNPAPWNEVKPEETPKLIKVNPQTQRRWERKMF